jgi:hypothetical protein
MTSFERLTLILGFVSAFGMPTLIAMARFAKRATEADVKLAGLVSDLAQLADRQGRQHSELSERLTYMERSELDYYRREARPRAGNGRG